MDHMDHVDGAKKPVYQLMPMEVHGVVHCISTDIITADFSLTVTTRPLCRCEVSPHASATGNSIISPSEAIAAW